MTQETLVKGRAPPADLKAPAGSAQPFSIRAAVWLMLTGSLATMVAVLYRSPSADTVRDQARDAAGGFGEIAGRIAVAGFWAAVVLTGVAAVGAWLWMARANGLGRPWARTASAVLASVLSVFMILSAFGATSLELWTGGAWAALIAWLAGLTAVVLLYRR